MALDYHFRRGQPQRCLDCGQHGAWRVLRGKCSPLNPQQQGRTESLVRPHACSLPYLIDKDVAIPHASVLIHDDTIVPDKRVFTAHDNAGVVTWRTTSRQIDSGDAVLTVRFRKHDPKMTIRADVTHVLSVRNALPEYRYLLLGDSYPFYRFPRLFANWCFNPLSSQSRRHGDDRLEPQTHTNSSEQIAERTDAGVRISRLELRDVRGRDAGLTGKRGLTQVHAASDSD